MKFPRILSLLLGLCFALCVNFSHAQLVDVSPPGTTPGPLTDVNLGLVAPPAGGSFYKNAQVTADPTTITVPNSFAPFGSRPITDKTGEDGSVSFRDINGVIIWVDNQNRAVLIPNSSSAKTLYVSNSECVLWQNRYDATFNTLGSESEVVIHRRNLVGQVVSTVVPSIIGTLLDTAPVTRTPSGYSLVAARQNLDTNHYQDFTQYRITLDGQLQTIGSYTIDPVILVGDTPMYDNLLNAVTTATAADGSMVIVTGDRDLLWVTWEAGQEDIFHIFNLPIGVNAIYVTNNRLLVYTGDEIVDYSKSGNDVPLETLHAVPVGTTILQFDTFTVPGDQILIYGVDGLDLQLYTIDGGFIALGLPLALPASINTVAPRVRNTKDGSLLVLSSGSPRIMWIKGTVDFGTGAINGLDYVTEIPLSSEGAPLFVSNQECVVWMNASSALTPQGDVAPAVISHFEDSGGPLALVKTDITPPIIGSHVASPPIFTPDPKSQGWFITIFQRSSNFSADIRTYRLQTLEATDSDGDGLFDWQEDALSTDLYNADTDGDGLSDGREVFPFYLVNGGFTYEQAKTDALNRGGILAVLETEIIRVGAERTIGSLATGNSYWLGGKGFLEPIFGFPNNRRYRWIYDGLVAAANTVIATPPWATGFPTTANGADSIAVNSSYEWTVLAPTRLNNYLFQFIGSNPRKPDTDLDGINDDDEYFNGNDPTAPDSFSGVPDLPAPAGPVPFSTAAIATKYYGLVYDPEQGHVASMTMQVSIRRAFSYSYQGLLSTTRASGRGTFTNDGKFSGVGGPTGLSDVISVNMQYVEQSPGVWIILGVMERSSGEFLGFELRRAKYNGRTNKYPTPTKYTMALPLADSVLSEPRGDAAITGTISAAGLTAFNVYLSNNARVTYSAPILDGELLAMNALSASLNKPVLIGPVNMASARPSLHYEGTLRLFAQAAVIRGQFISGIDQKRLVNGSRYSSPSSGFFPISGITATSFNTRYNLIGGDFGGVIKIGTWDLNHRISIPMTPTDRTTATFASTTGLLALSHTRTDATKNLFNATAKGYAVALQRPKQIRGYYHHAVTTGQLTVTKNDGTTPAITTISPVAQAVPVTFSEYYVQVVTPGDWEVRLPSGPVIISEVTTTDPVTGEVTVAEVETPWVSAEMVSGGVPDPVTGLIGLKGSGNGVVKITVQENTTNLWFYSNVEIAGINHKITQDYTVRR